MESLALYRSEDESESDSDSQPLAAVTATSDSSQLPSQSAPAAASKPIFASKFSSINAAPAITDDSTSTTHTHTNDNTQLVPLSSADSALQAYGYDKKNHLLGRIENVAVDSLHFTEQHNNHIASTHSTKRQKTLDTSVKQKRRATRDPTDVDNFLGPWAALHAEPEHTDEPDAQATLPPAEQNKLKATADDAAESKEQSKAYQPRATAFTPTTELHIPQLYDYQHRSYLHIPSTIKVNAAAASVRRYVPKQLLHSYTGHTSQVTRIRFFPGSGHLLLSGSNDHSMKLWNVSDDRYTAYQCLRTINAHSGGIRDIHFNNDGSTILSASYDRTVKLTDTETGLIKQQFSNGRTPNCIQFHPREQQQILVGQNDKKILQYDLRSNEVIQTYGEHMGGINTLTFLDDRGETFISSADDKKIFVWEYGIPIVIKHLAEPDMHSMPAIAVHPDGKSFVGQSQDNQIMVFNAGEKPKLNRNKRFAGHLTAGYACELGFSPDGQYLISGDARGRLFVWDWKTGKIHKKLDAHSEVCIGAVWHPLETSKVMTCSWDGNIKYWD